MPRTTATFSISVPPEMADEIERVRKFEHRTRSELVREALRKYIRVAPAGALAPAKNLRAKRAGVRSVKERVATLPEAEASPDEIEAIEEGRRQFRGGRSMIAPHAVARHAVLRARSARRRRRARAKKS